MDVDFRTVEVQSAQFVKVELKIGAGELKVRGGASSHLLEANFHYSNPDWKPELTYSLQEGKGMLLLRQPARWWGIFAGVVRNEWDLTFSDDIPMEMSLEFGAGKCHLNLGQLSLEKLRIRFGAGEGIIDFTGLKKSLKADVKGGVGRAQINLPKGVGIRVDARGGIGAVRAFGLRRDGHIYLNEEWGKSPVLLDLDIEGGIGEIELKG